MNKTKCASCGVKLTNENKQENKWDDKIAPICKDCFNIYSDLIKDVQVVNKKNKYPLWLAQYQ